MKESKAWLIFAEEYESGQSHPTQSPYLCDSLGYAEYGETGVATIPPKLRGRMKQRIDKSLKRGAFSAYEELGYDFNYPEEGRQARVLACLVFREQAKDAEHAR